MVPMTPVRRVQMLSAWKAGTPESNLGKISEVAVRFWHDQLKIR